MNMVNSETTFGLAGMAFFFLVLVLVVVVIVQLMKVWQAKSVAAKGESYQRLAEEAIHVQREIASHQKQAASELQDIKVRLASIEKMLKEVE
jgi:hypothetical protein